MSISQTSAYESNLNGDANNPDDEENDNSEERELEMFLAHLEQVRKKVRRIEKKLKDSPITFNGYTNIEPKSSLQEDGTIGTGKEMPNKLKKV